MCRSWRCHSNVASEKEAAVAVSQSPDSSFRMQNIESLIHSNRLCECSRYDYEGVDSDKANKVMSHLREVIASSKPGDEYGSFSLKLADDFEYTDPTDGSKASKQGLRFVFEDGSRMIFRLSGTGSAGATIRSRFLASWFFEAYNGSLGGGGGGTLRGTTTSIATDSNSTRSCHLISQD